MALTGYPKKDLIFCLFVLGGFSTSFFLWSDWETLLGEGVGESR